MSALSRRTLKRKLFPSEGVEEGKSKLVYETESKRTRPQWYCSNDPFRPHCVNSPFPIIPEEKETYGGKGKRHLLYEPFDDRQVCEYRCEEETKKNFNLSPHLQLLTGEFLSPEDISEADVSGPMVESYLRPGTESAAALSRAGYKREDVDVEKMLPVLMRKYRDEHILVDAYKSGNYRLVESMLDRGVGVSKQSLDQLIGDMNGEKEDEPWNGNILNIILDNSDLYELLSDRSMQTLFWSALKKSNNEEIFDFDEVTGEQKLNREKIISIINFIKKLIDIGAVNSLENVRVFLSFFSILTNHEYIQKNIELYNQIIYMLLNNARAKNPELFDQPEVINILYDPSTTSCRYWSESEPLMKFANSLKLSPELRKRFEQQSYLLLLAEKLKERLANEVDDERKETLEDGLRELISQCQSV